MGETMRGQVVLELGCGLGIGGISVVSCTEAQACVLVDAEPCMAEAAQVHLGLSSPAAKIKTHTQAVDLHNLDELHRLSADWKVSYVIAADLCYRAVSAKALANAITAALPAGGSCCIVTPLHYRTGMSRVSLVEALAEVGLQVVRCEVIDHGDAHYVFSLSEDGQQYLLC